ncbi:hypothetical protein C8A03DRAFT_18892, partial [Achaetomium macrosporum]
LVSLVANLVFLLGCVSHTFKDIALYRVNVTLLAEGLQKQAFNDTRGVAELRPSDLPTYWSWGTSGICDVYEPKDEVRCRRALPPTQNLITIVRQSLQDRYGSSERQLVDSVVSSWNATLNSLSPSVLRDKEARFASQSKASAALVVFAIILDVGILLSPSTSGHWTRWHYLPPVIASLISIAAGTLAILFMNDGVHGAVNTGEHAGPALIILFVGAGVRLLSAAVGCCFCVRSKDSGETAGFHDVALTPWHGRPQYGASPYQDPRPYQEPWSHQEPQPYQESQDNSPLRTDAQTREERNKDLGYEGEHEIYQLFGTSGLPNWSYQNWTSKLRSWRGLYEAFEEEEWRYADFTYKDELGMMPQVLQAKGVQPKPNWSQSTTYHIEVKTTDGPRTRPFFVSQCQADKMRRYHNDPLGRDAYILARVYGIEGQDPGVQWFPDPCDHSQLRFEGPENGKYRVTIM